MTSAIVLPPVQTWAQEKLTALYTASSTQAFDDAFDAFFSTSLQATLNGESLDHDAYKSQLSSECLLESSASVTVSNEVTNNFGALPTTESTSNANGSVVGLFYTVNFSEKIRVLGGPATHVANSSLNLVIKDDPSIQNPEPSGVKGGDFDPRRVFVLNQVLLDQPTPITLPTSQQ